MYRKDDRGRSVERRSRSRDRSRDRGHRRSSRDDDRRGVSRRDDSRDRGRRSPPSDRYRRGRSSSRDRRRRSRSRRSRSRSRSRSRDRGRSRRSRDRTPPRRGRSRSPSPRGRARSLSPPPRSGGGGTRGYSPADSFPGTRPPIKANPQKIYVGGLPLGIDEEKFKDAFRACGKISEIQLKGRFGFIEFAHVEDAMEAIKEKDGETLDGSRIIVRPHGTDHFSKPESPYYKPSSANHNRDLSFRGPPSHQIVPPRPSDDLHQKDVTGEKHRLLVLGLDERVSWQDLKDFGRNVASVNYANVFMRDGRRIGVIEYLSRENMEKALTELAGRKLYDECVKVEEDFGQYEKGGSRPSQAKHSYSRPEDDDEYLRTAAKSSRRDKSRSRSRERSQEDIKREAMED